MKTKGDFHKKLPDLKKLVLTHSKEKDLNNSIKDNQDNQIFPSNNITSFNVVENVIKSANRSGEKISSAKVNYQNVDNQKNNNSVVNGEKIIISNIYKNPEKEYLSITGIKYDEAPNDIGVENKSLSYADMKCIKTCCTCCNSKCSKKSIIQAENKNNMETSENDTNSEVPIEIQTCLKCCETRKQLNNFVAILNNDKVIKLHLNVEIANCSVSVMSDQINAKTTHETQACITIMKTEKETQVNFYEQLNEEIFENIIETEYIPQQSDDELKNIIKDDNKIVIINCSCCDCVNVHRLPQLNIKYKNNCNEDILHKLASAIEANKCECRNDVLSTQQKANPNTKTIATNNYEECEEKTLTITSVQKLSCSHETNTCNDNLNSDEFPKLIVAINEYSNQMSKKPDNIQTFVNSSTQTNWYNIMLEARYRTDGRYPGYCFWINSTQVRSVHFSQKKTQTRYVTRVPTVRLAKRLRELPSPQPVAPCNNANIGGFATWLDKKYEEYLQDSQCENNCLQYRSKQCSYTKSDRTINRQSFEFILRPQDMSRPASECCQK
ncbi:hypothetical protein RR48_10945 [Papilio machaon]|uniref:Uncharacterized protein n=1 Tax=Papilio machaon TaxID=76193 RepID=A0A194RCX5_PAPMA|nr:hypothetical protein RR48_10945 [Papilio machaon]